MKWTIGTVGPALGGVAAGVLSVNPYVGGTAGIATKAGTELAAQYYQEKSDAISARLKEIKYEQNGSCPPVAE